MTDDEINRRVAEIEGWVQDSIEGRGNVWIRPPSPPFTLSSDLEARSSPPPYATDWQWVGPLVPKHKIDIIWCSSGRPMALFGPSETRVSRTDDTPQRAICLAVIAAHSKEAAE